MDLFKYDTHHVPGKEVHTVDTLSHAYLPLTEHDYSQEKLAELLMVTRVAQLQASKERLETYHSEHHFDLTCLTFVKYCLHGWPNKYSLKLILAHHGIPETLISDNGPQFSSSEFKHFVAYELENSISSQHYPQSNGLAEQMVKTVKKLLK